MANQYVQTQVVCAVCGAVRGPSNHWYAIEYKGHTEDINGAMDEARLEIHAWDYRMGLGGELPACGELCLLRLVAKNLEKL